MNEAWVCAQCSTRNDAWRIGCSNCSAIRPDLSAATPRNEPVADQPTTVDVPAEAPPPMGDPTAAPTDAPVDTPTDAPPAVGWGQYGPVPPSTSLAAEDALPQAATSAPLWQRLPVGWILFGVILFGGAIGGLIFNASRGSSGAIERGGDMVVADLRVGDCFDLKDPSADEVDQVTALPCTEEHEYEVMHIGSMPDGPYPTDQQFSDWLDANCTPAFETYIGTPYEDSIYELFWFSPTVAGWNDGDHTIQCAVNHPVNHRLTESVRGAGG